ncbi:hypothetical protein [Brevibacillus brevis]|uniref:hypothetical protein n=1 Tax=Brevibacillus brevis TaxID=1393 RepID=UPI0007D89909|nr:hypothetical protein [Brevibacillus brevis]
MPPKGFKHRSETIKKMSLKLTGRKRSLQSRIKQSLTLKGHKFWGKSGHKITGQALQNMRDGWKKRYTPEYAQKLSLSQLGEKNNKAVLNEFKVREIRRKYCSGEYSQQSLASEYGVKRPTIADIVNKRTWTHI